MLPSPTSLLAQQAQNGEALGARTENMFRSQIELATVVAEHPTSLGKNSEAPLIQEINK